MRTAAAVLATLACLAPRAAAADTPLLRVDRLSGQARLHWAGGIADFTIFESDDPARVVSPTRVRMTAVVPEWIRADEATDPAVLFFQVGCPGGGCDETCFGDIDDDGDTLVDCGDPDCAGTPDCTPEPDCTNGLDDEGDDLADCDDPDCGRACDDGDPCTIDACDAAAPGGCTNVAKDCDDLDPCTIDSCSPADGSCLNDPKTCDDLDPCTIDSCNPADGSCLNDPKPCDDLDPCTIDSCDPADGSCLNDPKTCDDGDACNGLETCEAATGVCLPGTPVSCDDFDACTTDTCNPADGTCSSAIKPCVDGDACTDDTCDPAVGCLFPPIACSDGDACTTDTCDPSSGCDFVPLDCDDGVACTIDGCDPATGCTHDPDPTADVAVQTQLAGNQLGQFPFVEYVRAFNRDESIQVAIDPFLFPDIVSRTCDVYVVAARTAGEWCASGALTDVRGAPDTRTFTGASIEANTFPLVAPDQLSADAGPSLGRGYDVVLDCDRDGRLDATDYLDGGTGEPGFSVVHDITLGGPLATRSFNEEGPASPWPGIFPPWSPEGDDWRVYYPAALEDAAFTGTFPMIVISHGNGHSFAWYDALQAYLASYGFIVFTHDNNTFPGIETASSSTLYWTNKFIAEQATLAGGIFDGHLDTSRITWIGHSRGGEGVTRAYDRLFDGETRPAFALADIRLVVSMAPTDFLGAGDSDPHGVRYDLIYGAADGDVNGCANSDVADSFNIYERATGTKSLAYLHGANHEWFHDCDAGSDEGFGPDRISCDEQHRVQFGHFLALIEHHVRGNLAAKDFLWRQAESLKPSGVASTTVVVNEYRDAPGSGFVIDDFQTATGTGASSSGGTVTFTVTNLTEALSNDGNSDFNWSASDPMNGMTRVNAVEAPGDTERCAVFDWSAAASYAFDVVAGQRDWRGAGYLSLRAAQGTRHPNTTAVLEDLTFTVTLVDGAARTSSINIGAYGGGIEEPYQRNTCGMTGVGWANEFEVIRIRLTDFLHDATLLDLSDVRTVRLEFGPGKGASQGRLGLDDIRLSAE